MTKISKHGGTFSNHQFKGWCFFLNYQLVLLMTRTWFAFRHLQPNVFDFGCNLAKQDWLPAKNPNYVQNSPDNQVAKILCIGKQTKPLKWRKIVWDDAHNPEDGQIHGNLLLARTANNPKLMKISRREMVEASVLLPPPSFKLTLTRINLTCWHTLKKLIESKVKITLTSWTNLASKAGQETFFVLFHLVNVHVE